jgi:hypothetical protein
MMTQLRIWHASRDPYHCAFRMLRILAAGASPMSIDRLRVLDMFLLYPPLLHRVSAVTNFMIVRLNCAKRRKSMMLQSIAIEA